MDPDHHQLPRRLWDWAVIIIDHDIYGNVTPDQVPNLLKNYD